MAKITLSNDCLTVGVSTFGAEIISVKKGGKERMWQGDAVWDRCAPVLFPICGGLRDGAFVLDGKSYPIPKHGFAKDMEFELENADKTHAVLLLKANSETLKIYPFLFELRVRFVLIDDKIEIKYEVKNADLKQMYFSVGGHESYACKGGIEHFSMIFEKDEPLNASVVAGVLLSGKTVQIPQKGGVLKLKSDYFKDDALVFCNLKSRKVTLKNNLSGEETVVWFDGFDYLLLWTVPNEEFLCIEPWCGISDFADCNTDLAHKKGIVSLAPGETSTKTHTIQF